MCLECYQRSRQLLTRQVDISFGRANGNVGEAESGMINECYDKCINEALEGGKQPSTPQHPDAPSCGRGRICEGCRLIPLHLVFYAELHSLKASSVRRGSGQARFKSRRVA